MAMLLATGPAARREGSLLDDRLRWIVLGIALIFAVVAGQLVRLAVRGQQQTRIQMAEPISRTFARPDVEDRNARLIATDLEGQSVFADPVLVIDPDEAAERLSELFPGLDATELRRLLADKTKRFVWIRRGLTPGIARRVLELGLPGISFKREPKRAYPLGRFAGHVLGRVSIDNQGVGGIERWIDESVGVDPYVPGAQPARTPVRLTLDVGVQHALEEELSLAQTLYRAAGAAGIVLDVNSGEVLGAASVPDIDPARPQELLESDRLDRLEGGAYELGSVFKTATIAMALDDHSVTPDTVFDVRQPLRIGRFLIRDIHPLGRPLTVREIFIHSSNVGAGMMARDAGAGRLQAFLGQLGLLTQIRTEAGNVYPPRLPQHWGEAEVITIAYGHGLAVAPLQFATAMAALVNGGVRVSPTFVVGPRPGIMPQRVVSTDTSAKIRDLMRRNVVVGTGKRAEVPGYEVGGKTGTAELAVKGGYAQKSVIASFLAAFPMRAPRYLVFVMLNEPAPTSDTAGQITAGLNAAPIAGRIIARVAPIMGVPPVDADPG
jgi:cell division protein FtsI (penicillin-binding protein 3)